MDAGETRGKAIVFACGCQEPLSDYPEIYAHLELQGIERFARRLHMPEGVLCSRHSANTEAYWAMVVRLITANAGTDWPITQRPLGELRPRFEGEHDDEC